MKNITLVKENFSHVFVDDNRKIQFFTTALVFKNLDGLKGTIQLSTNKLLLAFAY